MGTVSYEDALEAVRSRLNAKNAKHSKRVAATAADLASAYGVDVEEARLAGILHDFDRERGGEELLATARGAGLVVSDGDLANPHLLHSRAGALDARDALPGLPDAVVQAISRHTLGAPDMSDLDMVIYLADMIEPHRDYAGVDDLRAAVGKSPLRDLFAIAYQQSVCYLVEARRYIHPQTVDVWNWIVSGDRA